ncbi:hypothetical protein AAG906_004397 [Vitis piasezkii]
MPKLLGVNGSSNSNINLMAHCGTKLSWLPKLSSHFALRDLGDISYFLGIEVTRLPHVLHLNQQRYIHQLLERADLLGAKSASTPGALGKLLSTADGEPLFALDATHYHSLVAGISFAINRACQYMAHPTTSHPQLITSYQIALLSSNQEAPVAFVFFFCTNLISWASTKQRVVFHSSAELEYRALAFLAEHIEIDIHFVHDKVFHKELLIQYVPSIDQLADVFTKHVPSWFLTARLSIVPRHRGMIDKHPHQVILLLSNRSVMIS